MLDLRQTTRCAKFVLVVVISALGCSRQMAEPMAETPSPEAKVAGKGESAEAAAPVAAQSSNPQAVFGRRIAQLSSEAAGHERRGYFDSAIAARQEIVRLFAERSGPEAWETRSAEEALERTMRLGKLTPQERATCDAAEGRERQAYQLWKQNRAQDAITALAEARLLAERVWGPNSYGVANMLDQQARWQLAVGDLASAEALFRRALVIREKTFSRDHPDTVASICALGLALQSGGRREDAEPLLREAADRAGALWGDEHVEHATHLNNLGMLLHDMARSDEAIELLTRAMTIRRRALARGTWRWRRAC